MVTVITVMVRMVVVTMVMVTDEGDDRGDDMMTQDSDDTKTDYLLCAEYYSKGFI